MHAAQGDVYLCFTEFTVYEIVRVRFYALKGAFLKGFLKISFPFPRLTICLIQAKDTQKGYAYIKEGFMLRKLLLPVLFIKGYHKS